MRHTDGFCISSTTDISIHAPTWGATNFFLNDGKLHRFQSTHPRGVRRTVRLSSRYYMIISIHAPTWGATAFRFILSTNSLFQSTHPRGVRLFGQVRQWIYCPFQSTHPRGVRQSVSSKICPVTYFNPRTHVGCDDQIGWVTLSQCISIHAPTWGATQWYFYQKDQNTFQSTHPRGVRHS